jgi:hypothetical protein
MLIACSQDGGAFKPTPLPNAANSVDSVEKVLVSCCIIATTHFISGSGFSYSSIQGKAGKQVAQLRNCETRDARKQLAGG